MMSVLEQSFWDRLAGVITLRRPTYEAIEHDPQATAQSWLIVVFLGLANGIAMIVTPIIGVVPGLPPQMAENAENLASVFAFDTTERQLLALVAGIVGAVLSWYVSSWLLRAIGTRMAAQAGTTITPEQMRRLVAWGYAPSLASFLAPIPAIGPLLATVGSFWAFVTGVMAVRTAFNVGIGKAIVIEIVAFLLVLIVVTTVVLITVMLAWPLA